jgi:tetratricopeptide (TPR) repeat protein
MTNKFSTTKRLGDNLSIMPADESIEDLKAEVNRLKRAENWLKCINVCREAAAHAKPSDLPCWFWIKTNLALALTSADSSERPQNLEEAIAIYKEILDQLPGRTDRFKWAHVQRSLAFAYDQRVEGNKTENLEQMIDHLSESLEVFNRDDYPDDWAIVKGALAVAYSARTIGEPAENLRMAIQNLEDSMSILTQERFPEDWEEAEEELSSLRARLGAIKKP